MLDLRFIRKHTDVVRNAIRSKKETDRLDDLLALDTRRRLLIQQAETLKSRRNVASAEVGRLKREKKGAEGLIREMKTVSDSIAELDSPIRGLEEEMEGILLTIPNVPHESVPVGSDAGDNVEVHRWTPPDGTVIGLADPKSLDFPLLDHVALGKELGILDFERGGKISGSGFPLYLGKGATLERALINFMLDLHIHAHGYKEVFPPFLANRVSMRATGQIPKLEEDMYHVEPEDLFPIPTAEVPLTNIHRGEMLAVEDLPCKYAAYSPCFRREAGSYGKETKGFLRVHQFNKVELVKLSLPETSYDEHESLLRDAEAVLQLLNIPHRVVLLCTGDLSFSAAKCYDIEVWSPVEGQWLEASSVSNFEDFQARRANIRFRRDPKSKPEFVHTLNGSGVATSRLMVALLENYQTPERKVIVPKVLHAYTGFEVIG